MKKVILLFAWVFINVSAYAQSTAQKPGSSVSNFTNPDNVFMIIAIIVVTAFVLIPIYSLSHAVKVLAGKVEKK